MKSTRILFACLFAAVASFALVRAEEKAADKKVETTEKACCVAKKSCCDGEGKACCSKDEKKDEKKADAKEALKADVKS